MNAVRQVQVDEVALAGQNVKVTASSEGTKNTLTNISFYTGKKEAPRAGDKLRVTIAWAGEEE